jgi:23S rRNA pseudouridine1911/1915/1917 synthase
MNIKILYEDKNFLAIDKPAGVAVHSDGKSKKPTIADWVLSNYPSTKNVGEALVLEREGGKKEKILRPGIVHRLDRETSGVLLIAKNQKTFLFLKDQFQNHKIKKTYRAFVYGLVSDPKASLLTGGKGVIKVPIGRSPKDIRAYTAGRGARPPLREAITEYKVLAHLRINADNKPIKTDISVDQNKISDFSYLEIYPKTGRTHQIRVHMRYINHPVVSDPIYRGTKDLALGMKRLALHASSITFSLPDSGKTKGEIKTIEAPLPTDFKKAIKTYIE